MDYKIIWSPDALEDIEAIGEFIARDSLFYAESTVQKIFEAPRSLIQHPKLGRVVPEIGNESIRELFVFQYRVIYEIKPNEILILTVIHGKRLFDKDKI
jgi:plasmid stabilization system protein ParE